MNNRIQNKLGKYQYHYEYETSGSFNPRVCSHWILIQLKWGIIYFLIDYDVLINRTK